MVIAISALATALATGVMIWAVYVAPQKAFEVQWKLQLEQEARERRMEIFKTLMVTRGNALHYRHVEALNLIDVEFSEVSEKDIRDAWKAYLDHLNIQLPNEPRNLTKPNVEMFRTSMKSAARISSLNCCRKWVHGWDTTLISPI